MENNLVEKSYVPSNFNVFAVGDTVKLAKNSENIDLVEHILGFKGKSNKAIKRETCNGSVWKTRSAIKPI